MWEFLEKLRALPEEKRRSLAFFTAIAITLLIVVPWFAFRVSTARPDEKSVSQVATPFSLIAKETQEMAANVKSGWSGFSAMTAAFTSTVKKQASTTIQ